MDDVMNKLPGIAMGAWAWGDTGGYFGNTMTGEELRPDLGSMEQRRLDV